MCPTNHQCHHFLHMQIFLKKLIFALFWLRGVTMLLGEMNIYRLMIHAQQVESDKLREQSKENKKARTGNYDYSQQKWGGGNLSQSQQKFSAPTSSSTSVPSSKNRYDKKGRALDCKSQGSVSGTKTYPTYSKCGKNHLGECLEGKKVFGCGQYSHRSRDFPSKQGQGCCNGNAQSTTSAAPAIFPTHEGNSSSTGGSHARTGFMLFRLSRIKKVLMMQSLVRYESLTLLFMHY